MTVVAKVLDTTGFLIALPLFVFGVYLEGSLLPIREWWAGVVDIWTQEEE